MGRNDSVILANGMQIIELDSFVTAFPVQPGKESATKRRFMTLFAADEQVQVGGTSYVCKVQSFTGETFALKRLLTASMLPTDANMTPEDRARTRGHAAAFYEEYKNQLLVSHMRGFPKLYGYGTIGDDPAIIMEWVEGVSVRDIARRRSQDGPPIATHTIAKSALQCSRRSTRSNDSTTRLLTATSRPPTSWSARTRPAWKTKLLPVRSIYASSISAVLQPIRLKTRRSRWFRKFGATGRPNMPRPRC